MQVTIDLPGFFLYLVTGWEPPDDPGTVIGLGMVAYLSEKDPAHIFIHPALWHDAAYMNGSEVQAEQNHWGEYTWPRWKADKKLLDDCLHLAENDIELIKEALTLYLVAREWGEKAWENVATR